MDPPTAGKSRLSWIQKVDEVERRAQWNFLMADDGWRWKVVKDGAELASAQAFPTLKECTTDAALNGYVVWKSEDERRRR